MYFYPKNCLLITYALQSGIYRGYRGFITVNYSNVEGGWAGNENEDFANIYFVDPQPASEAPTALGDYHLNSNSPCIDQGTDAGAPSDDIDGEDRPNGTGYDMGSDEYTSAY
ncbi:hypothetical protein HY745_12485 [Candidatus Desantisbacteria bacterium]|nr:hypothetical protein [Candidatus Desantisbacteria bacterium]